jgi:uncharacterized protein
MIPSYDDSCRAPLWARGGQAQTLLGYFLPTPGEALDEEQPGVTRAEVQVADDGGGDRVVVFSAGPFAAPANEVWEGVTVHLFHGLAGSSESNYMRLAARTLRARGARVRLFNHRGQGAGEGLAHGIYHSGSWPDLFASIAEARATEARPTVHIAVGFSLSANTLLLGSATSDPLAIAHPGHPDAVLAVNPPVDLVCAVDRISGGVNRLYDRNFVRGMRRALEVRRALAPERYAHAVIPRGATVRDADELVTAPSAGYGSADEYYRACSSAPLLAALRVPTVVLSSGDDPFVSSATIARAVADAAVTRPAGAPPLHLHLEPTGGHLGYLASGGERWLAGALGWYVERLRESVEACSKPFPSAVPRRERPGVG